MNEGQFLVSIQAHLKGRELPFKVEDVTEVDIKSGFITLSNDEHPYIIRIEKLPIESDWAEGRAIPADADELDAQKEFFWKDHSGRGFTNTFNEDELYENFHEHVDDHTEFYEWIQTCNVGDEYDSGTPNEIKRIK